MMSEKEVLSLLREEENRSLVLSHELSACHERLALLKLISGVDK